MIEELFVKYLPILIHIFEIMGIIILTIGSFTAFAHYLMNRFGHKDYNVNYEFANTMITALDFKLAAEILKTVTVSTKEELLILAIVFILRIIMTFVLEKELSMENSNK